MIEALLSKEKTLVVIGLGYVGLPVALAFARKCRVVGFDINRPRLEMMRRGEDPSGELPAAAFEGCDILYTDDPADLKDASFYIVAVPTPIDEHNSPDLTPLLKATETVAKVLKKGDYVVFESTVYPGCTEEECVPILEKSGLKYREDFKVGFSPERINPGDPVHALHNTVKIVSGCCEESLNVVRDVYALVVEAGLHMAPSIKVAESAKIIENTQRDLNIALMNEVSMILDKMDVNTYDVIEAAGTKWNFQKYEPGLVGGHCIGVDPYYLTYKAIEVGHHPKVILAGRAINDGMAEYVAARTLKKLIKLGKSAHSARILVMGITFKENVQDVRNSKVANVVRELVSFGLNVEVVDPHAEPEEVESEYGITLIAEPKPPYDALMLAVKHDEYLALEEADFLKLVAQPALFVDIKGEFRKKISQMEYWSL